MRTVETAIYTYAELSPDAQRRAISDYRECMSGDTEQWVWRDAHASRTAFLREFNAEFHQGRYGSESVHIPVDSWSNPVGDLEYVRLWKYLHANHADCIVKIGDCQFTGVCHDENLLDGIAEFIRRPYRTDFESLLYSCCEDLRLAVEAEIEYQNSDEQIAESIIANDYEFNDQGELV